MHDALEVLADRGLAHSSAPRIERFRHNVSRIILPLHVVWLGRANDRALSLPKKARGARPTEAYRNTATMTDHPRNTTFIRRGMAGVKSTMGIAAMACDATRAWGAQHPCVSHLRA